MDAPLTTTTTSPTTALGAPKFIRGSLHLLTEKQAAAAPLGWTSDGGGLTLRVRPGSRSWYFRYTPAGKVRYHWLGRYPDLTLTAARALAATCRQQLATGIDPKEHAEREAQAQRQAQAEAAGAQQAARAQRQAVTVKQAILDFHAKEKHQWTAGYAASWLAQFERHIIPKLGDRPLVSIEPPELLDVLREVWVPHPPTGIKVRDALAAVYDDAIFRGVLKYNAANACKPQMREKGKKGKAVGHHAGMRAQDVCAFIKRLRTEPSVSDVVRDALELLILTGARSKEILQARADQFDLAAGRWHCPGNAMKMGATHEVYLCPRACQIVQANWPQDPQLCTLLFPSPQKRFQAMCNMTFLKALERMGLWGKDVPDPEAITVHGFRSTFDTWANENLYDIDIIEHSIDHKPRGRGAKVRAAYNHAEYDQLRQRLMNDWADFCAGKKVRTPLSRVATKTYTGRRTHG